MPDINEWKGAGNLTRDPELRYSSGGKAWCTFAVAVTKRFRSNGETKDRTTFVDCKCFDKVAEWIGESLKRGDSVYVEGSLTSDEWEDRETGKKRSKMLVMARRVQSLHWDTGGSSQGNTGRQAATQSTPQPRPIEEDIPNDDIPF